MTIKCDIWCYTLRQEEEEARGCTGVADHYQCQASLFCLHTLYHHPRQHHQHVFRSLNGKTKIMQQTNKWCSWSSQKTFLRGRWQWASIGHFVFLFVVKLVTPYLTYHLKLREGETWPAEWNSLHPDKNYMGQNLFDTKFKWNNIYMTQKLYDTKFIWDNN